MWKSRFPYCWDFLDFLHRQHCELSQILWAAPLHVGRGLQWMEGFTLTKALLLALHWGFFYTTTPLSLCFTQIAVLNIPHTMYGGAGQEHSNCFQ